MRRPPSPAFWQDFPVTSITALLAISVTFVWMTGRDISFLFCNFEVPEGQVWRLVTCTLPHVNVMHLAFNVYWLWVFGTAIENEFGSWRTLAILLLFAIASSAADFALDQGGVGLSGVGYGLFGLLWVLSRYDERFFDAVDAQTILLFVFWYFLCIWITKAHIMAVGNVAHGAGAIVGLLLGRTLVTQGIGQSRAGLVTAGFVGLCLFGALVARPDINFGADIGLELAKQGYRDLKEGRNERAVEHLREAVKHNNHQPTSWFNLGIGYTRLGQDAEALDAFQHAVDLDPNSAEFRKALDDWKGYMKQKGRK